MPSFSFISDTVIALGIGAVFATLAKIYSPPLRTGSMFVISSSKSVISIIFSFLKYKKYKIYGVFNFYKKALAHVYQVVKSIKCENVIIMQKKLIFKYFYL